METKFQSSSHEQTLIRILRKLPPTRATELINFARFLELQATQFDDEDENIPEEEELQANEAKWNQLLSRPESKKLLREMALEALDDYRAGDTTDIIVTEDGRLAPE